MKPIKEGKVREIYDNGDSLIMVATDRISCFDVILNNAVTKKGTVVTQISRFSCSCQKRDSSSGKNFSRPQNRNMGLVKDFSGCDIKSLQHHG